MIALVALFVILVGHYLADFVFQSDRIAKGKSKSMYVLLQHVCFYGAVLCAVMQAAVLTGLLPKPSNGLALLWGVFNVGAHFVIDFFTSRGTSRFFGRSDFHNAFVVIGFDQLLHYVCLTLSYVYLLQ